MKFRIAKKIVKAAREGRHSPGKIAKAKTVVLRHTWRNHIPHTSALYLESLKSDAVMESLRDRNMKIDIPYLESWKAS